MVNWMQVRWQYQLENVTSAPSVLLSLGVSMGAVTDEDLNTLFCHTEDRLHERVTVSWGLVEPVRGGTIRIGGRRPGCTAK
jgi:hypothetical protein